MCNWAGLALIAIVTGLAPAATAQSKQDWGKIASDILHQKTPGDKGNLSRATSRQVSRKR